MKPNQVRFSGAQVRKVLIIILSCLILIIAILPWGINGGNIKSLVPSDLRQEPLSYDATVTAARVSTIEAARSATSIIEVIPIGTVDIPDRETQPPPTSIVRIMTITNTIEVDSQEAPIPTASSTELAEGVPPTPIGLIDTKDIITEEQLTEQLKAEPEGSQLKDLKVFLTENGFEIECVLMAFPAKGENIEVKGEFLVKNYSLVVSVSSIILNGRDVTLLYHEEIESRMDTSLYKLLPERYVQTYTLMDGKILVFSKIRK